jgi:hypothetical protein
LILLIKRVSSTKKMPDHGQDNCDIKADTGQMSTSVEILLPMSHNTLTSTEEVYTMKDMHFKSEIAQQELSDLRRRPLAL